jgi:hypothetical protein
MDAVTHLAPIVGVVAACDVLSASFYGQRPVLGPSASPAPEPAVPTERPAPARSLSPDEHASVLDSHRVSHPGAEGESGECRDQLGHPAYHKPELPATRPQPALEMGHHQAAGSGQADVLLSLRERHRVSCCGCTSDSNGRTQRRAGAHRRFRHLPGNAPVTDLVEGLPGELHRGGVPGDCADGR